VSFKTKKSILGPQKFEAQCHSPASTAYGPALNKYLAALQRTCNNPTALGDGAVGYIAAEHNERLGINQVLQWQASTVFSRSSKTERFFIKKQVDQESFNPSQCVHKIE
jgi:hypothetical protein